MTHAEAIQKAIYKGLTHGDSIYGYRPRKLSNMLRSAENDDEWNRSQTDWNFDGESEIWNDRQSERHHCWAA